MIGFVGSTSTAKAHNYHGRAEREDGKGNGTLRATKKERPLAPPLREPQPRNTTHWDELMRAYTEEGVAKPHQP